MATIRAEGRVRILLGRFTMNRALCGLFLVAVAFTSSPAVLADSKNQDRVDKIATWYPARLQNFHEKLYSCELILDVPKEARTIEEMSILETCSPLVSQMYNLESTYDSWKKASVVVRNCDNPPQAIQEATPALCSSSQSTLLRLTYLLYEAIPDSEK
jgi:hypothetical protein